MTSSAPSCTGSSTDESPLVDRVAAQVDRLLAHCENLQRANAVLQEQLTVVVADRDALRKRMDQARTQIENVLQHLPTDATGVVAEYGARETPADSSHSFSTSSALSLEVSP